jgi:hypothetical protein
VSPPILYVTCPGCGHSSAVGAPQEPLPALGDQDTERFERIVRTVVADFDLPADVVLVSDTAQGWQVVLRTTANRIVRVHVLVADAGPIRDAITRALAHG